MDLAQQSKTKVIHYVEAWLPPTSNWLYNHIKHLPNNVDSYVVCQWTQNPEQFPTPNLFSAEEPPGELTFVRRALRRMSVHDHAGRHSPLLEEVMQRVQPDVVHSHFGQCGVHNAHFVKKRGVPHIVSFYGLDASYLPANDPRWVSRYEKMGRDVDLVLCEGPHMATSIARFGIPTSKIKIFRLGIDLSTLPFELRRRPMGRTVRFLMAGSFREKKGIPIALDALGLFSRTYPDIEVTIIGGSSGSVLEEAEKQKIMDSYERSNLGDKVRFAGYQPHDALIRELYRHHIFLSPSATASNGDTEGGAPVTIIEAAASGMPVVSTTHCDIPFVLGREYQSYLVPERDAEALSAAIASLVRRQDWAAIAAENRKMIESELDVQLQSRRLGDIYASLI